MRDVSYQLDTVQLPSVSVGCAAILAFKYSSELGASTVDNLCNKITLVIT